ncbi:hypothetical protein [Anaeromicropila populeti]|uniref:Uncharacterized protein n=1 Tax=Anaeromicropila populeti TaxID=37658 RepID=A0A1I6K5T7_9FIRM|nr:hypothetical protein [Anaeromicropila populeti]SFR86592.1 hypothetical protein SAMN05661086_02214 [Anaeromicropila populeti]
MSILKKMKYIFLISAVCLLSGCGTATEQPEVTETELLEDNTERDETILTEAISCIQDKKYPQAIGLLSGIEGNEQAEDLLRQLRYLISGSYIANLNTGVAAIDNTGKVKIEIDDTVYKEIGLGVSSDWENIISLSDGGERLDALDKDGIIHSTSDEDVDSIPTAEKLKSYSDISMLSTDFDNYVLLSSTGQIDAYSKKDGDALDYYKNEVSSLRDVVDVVTGQSRIAALKRDGTVYVADYDKYCNIPDADMYDEIAEWTDIVDISADTIGPIAGLKSDGTVVCSKTDLKGLNGEIIKSRYPYDVSGWNNIIAISNGNSNLLGLKRDGTVVATGNNEHKQLEVSDWQDIVAIAAGDWISIGLKSDGTLVIAGEVSENVDQPDVSGINNLYVPTINY